ncbi:hypothetical protein L0128_18110 [candidate division KSB1 bacterium]|nr:hypothetical protein [candidate division KSB1 bacterium]
MSGLNKTEQAWLQEKFGDLVNFDRNERVLYSHDIAAMPGLFKPLIGNTIPDAVVQPSSENLLQDLVRWAVLNKIPLTPRGKAWRRLANPKRDCHRFLSDEKSPES